MCKEKQIKKIEIGIEVETGKEILVVDVIEIGSNRFTARASANKKEGSGNGRGRGDN